MRSRQARPTHHVGLLQRGFHLQSPVAFVFRLCYTLRHENFFTMEPISKTEGQNDEFKVSLDDDVLKWVCAFAFEREHTS